MQRQLLLIFIGSLIFTLGGCANRVEHRWVRPAATQTEHDLDLAAARAEAWKTYPEWKALDPERQAALRTKFPKKSDAEMEEHLAKMRHSVESLYMEAHNWHLVTVDAKGRVRGAHTH
jgi:hypothetical protein